MFLEEIGDIGNRKPEVIVVRDLLPPRQLSHTGAKPLGFGYESDLLQIGFARLLESLPETHEGRTDVHQYGWAMADQS